LALAGLFGGRLLGKRFAGGASAATVTRGLGPPHGRRLKKFLSSLPKGNSRFVEQMFPLKRKDVATDVLQKVHRAIFYTSFLKK